MAVFATLRLTALPVNAIYSYCGYLLYERAMQNILVCVITIDGKWKIVIMWNVVCTECFDSFFHV